MDGIHYEEYQNGWKTVATEKEIGEEEVNRALFYWHSTFTILIASNRGSLASYFWWL